MVGLAIAITVWAMMFAVVLSLVITALAMADGWSVGRLLGLDMSSAFVLRYDGVLDR